jgi:lipoate---protein ligase
MWKLLDTGKKNSQENMDLDAKLLEELSDAPILHLYDWEGPSATHGYFVKPGDFLDLEGCSEEGLTLGRRPTGGGIVFHVSDLAFSVLVPRGHEGYSDNTLENYAFVNRRVLRAVERLLSEHPDLLPEDPVPLDKSCANFCMAKPTIYDVMMGSRKVAGAAQRRRRHGYLHQGSISIAMPERSFLEKVLLPGSRVLEAMESNSYTMRGDLGEMRRLIREKLIEEFNG